jgi:hypothetical protein
MPNSVPSPDNARTRHIRGMELNQQNVNPRGHTPPGRYSSPNQSSSNVGSTHSPIRRNNNINNSNIGTRRNLRFSSPDQNTFLRRIGMGISINHSTEDTRISQPEGLAGIQELGTHPLPDEIQENRSSSESSHSTRTTPLVTALTVVANSEQGTNNASVPNSDQGTNTYVSHPTPIIPSSNGNSNLFTVLGLIAVYIFAGSSGSGGGSIPPSLPGSSFGPPLQPPLPPMGIVGNWSSSIASIIAALAAAIGKWIKMCSKSEIIVDNPNLAPLVNTPNLPNLVLVATAAVGVYLLRRKGILVMIGFLLIVLAGYLLWKLKLSSPSGVMKLLQGGSTSIMLSSETIVLAIAFTVTVTAACIVGLVIKITGKN